jgi:hypothetical protein
MAVPNIFTMNVPGGNALRSGFPNRDAQNLMMAPGGENTQANSTSPLHLLINTAIITDATHNPNPIGAASTSIQRKCSSLEKPLEKTAKWVPTCSPPNDIAMVPMT